MSALNSPPASRLPAWLEQWTEAEFLTALRQLPPLAFYPVSTGANRDYRWIPQFAENFWQLLNEGPTLPSQEFFAGFYCARYVDARSAAPAYQGTTVWDMRHRALRNYPSFIREIHLIVLIQDWLRHHAPQYRLVSSAVWDNLGVDGVLYDLLTHEPCGGYRSYVATAQGTKMAWRKQTFRHEPPPFPLVDLALPPRTSREVNGIWLYPETVPTSLLPLTMPYPSGGVA